MVCGESIVVAGGAERFTEVYDLATKVWSELAPMQVPRAHCGAIYLQDEIYLVGGVTTKSRAGSKTELVAVGASKLVNRELGWEALPWGKFGEICLFGSGGLLPSARRR